MVLVLSQWVDYEAHMLWLDSLDPSNGTATTPGVSRYDSPASPIAPTVVLVYISFIVYVLFICLY